MPRKKRNDPPDRYGRMLVADLDQTATGGGLMASLCIEAADRIRRQDHKIIQLTKRLQRAKKQLAQAPTAVIQSAND